MKSGYNEVGRVSDGCLVGEILHWRALHYWGGGGVTVVEWQAEVNRPV